MFEPGMRIVVTSSRSYHGHNFKGRFGTVTTNWYGGSIGVTMDDIKNPRSKYGYFYFGKGELEPVNVPNNKMEEKNMTKITNHLNVAYVTLCDGRDRPTVYGCANFDESLTDGYLCVFNSYGVYRLGRVIEIKENDGTACFHEIVARVDTLDYDNRITTRKAAEELKTKMEARAKQLQDIALYQMLAKDDPDMAALLQEYQSLGKV